MSKSLARAVVGFANLVTLPLKSYRRHATKVTASEFLAQLIPVETRLGELRFYANTRRSCHYPWQFHTDEPDTLVWIESLPEGAVLWDVGANIGVFSLYAALRPGVRVVAFEPGAASFGLLNKNIEINSMDDRITAYPIAFNDRTTLDVLNMATTVAGSSMHAFGTTTNAHDDEIQVMFRQGAVGFSIDDFVRLFDPPPPTHLKIDVDSIEAEIIDGGRTLLTDGPVRSVWVKIMGPQDTPRNAAIIGRLESLGYARRPRENPQYRNMEFVRE